jgi:predicted RNase H-like HicB family nuclease
MITREYTAVLERHGRWYIGYVEEISGVNTQGRTLSEVRRNLREALRMILRANRRLLPKRAAGTIRERIAIRA